MARIGRSLPASHWIEPNLGGPEFGLGPDPALYLSPLAVVTTPGQLVVRTYFVNATLARRQSEQRRFPLQGWEGDESLGGFSTLNISLAATTPQALGINSSTQQVAVKFVPGKSDSSIDIAVLLFKNGSPSDNVVIALQGDSDQSPDGVVLGSVSTAASSISAAAAGTLLHVSIAATVVVGGNYWLVFSRDGALSSANFIQIGASTPIHPRFYITKLYNGTTWSTQTNSLFYQLYLQGPVLISRNLGPRPPFIDPMPSPNPPIETVDAVTVVARQRRIPLPKSLLFPVQTLAQPPPLVTTLLSSFAMAQYRRTTDARRFPLQGWEVVPCDETNGNPLPTASISSGPVARTQGLQLDGGSVNEERGQQFSSVRGVVTSVTLYLKKTASPTDNLVVEIQPSVGGNPSGTVLASATPIAGTTLTTSFAPYTFTFPAPTEISGIFWLVLRRDGGADTVNFYSWDVEVASSAEGGETVLRSGSWIPGTILYMGATITFVPFALQQRLVSRFLGPRPPLVIGPLPTQQQQTVARGGVPFVTIERRLLQVRQPKSLLFPPATLAQPPPVTAALRALSRARPRHTLSFFIVPATVEPESVALAERTIRITLTRTRPRPTKETLRGLIFYPATSEISVALTRIRPRPTRHVLTSVFYPATSEITVTLVRARPRPTLRRLYAPATLTPYAIELLEETVRVTLVRTRPRPTRHTLTPPTVLQVFTAPPTPLVRTRPRPTAKFLSEPTVVRIPSVEQREDTVTVTVVRTRPRPTTHVLGEPTVLQTFSGPAVTTIRTRPRPTAKTLGKPTAVRVPSVEQREDTIAVTLVRIRPRPTTKAEFAPTKLIVPSVEQHRRTITVALVKTRPRPTARTLAPPTVVSHPPVGEIVATANPVRDRRALTQRFPNQGQRQRVVRETGSTVTYQQRDPFIGPRPPQIIDPLPGQRAETITTAEVAVRTQREWGRHFPLPGFRQALIRETGQGTSFIEVGFSPFLGVRPPQIVGPLPTQPQQTVTVKTVSVRTRVEQSRHFARFNLAAPTVAAKSAFFGPEVTLVRTRPRPTRAVLSLVIYPATGEISVTLGGRTRADAQRRAPHYRLAPPTRLRIPSVEQREDTITVALARTRPRKTSSRRITPTVYPATSTILVALTRARPRPTRTFVRPPAVVRVPAVEQAEETIRVALTRTRPRPTAKFLRAPRAAILTFSTGKPALARIRPSKTHTIVAPPTVIFEERPPERFEVAVQIVRIGLLRRGPYSRLHAPVVVEPTPLPTADQRTIRVVLATQPRVALLRRAPHFKLPVLIPPPPIPGWTDGHTISSFSTSGETVPADATDGTTSADAAADGRVAPVAESDGKTAPSSATDGRDKRSGTP